MKAKELFGKEVIDAEAKVVGKVADIDLDIGKATIFSIVVKSGLTSRIVISPRDIAKVGDTVVLKVARDKIQKA